MALTRRTFFWGAAAAAARVSAAAGPVRVLLVTGGHDHPPSFYSVLDGEARVTVTVDGHPSVFSSDLRKRYDVLLLHDMVQVEDVSERRRANLRLFAESGKGIVVTHHALCSYWQWEWWWKEVTGVRYLMKPDGSQPASSYRHDEPMTVKPTGSHPILSGVEEMRFVDETYKGVWTSPLNVPLLVTDNPESDRVVASVSGWKGARVVVLQPGHGSEAHRHSGYRRLLRNAVLWSAGEWDGEGSKVPPGA